MPVPKRVIIPKFPESNIEKYFVPRFLNIVRGDVVEWLNADEKEHCLVFTRVSGIHSKKIKPNQKVSIKFPMEFTSMRIDYSCSFHPSEQGTIIIYPKDENLMTNTKRIRFLSKVFNITPPDFLSHLGSSRNE